METRDAGMTFQPNEVCTKCSGFSLPGTVATARYVQEKFAFTYSLGIYDCRNVAGKPYLSNHACGRAWDCGVPMFSNGAANTKLGFMVVNWFKTYSTQLGVIDEIYNRVIYDDLSPNGRYYGGVNPHRNHVHMTQSKSKALSLTYAKIVAFAGPTVWTPVPPPPAPIPIPPTTDWTKKVIMALPTLKQGSSGTDVKRAQGLLTANGVAITIDGDFGPKTKTSTITFQKSKGLVADGIIGQNTWTKLLGE